MLVVTDTHYTKVYETMSRKFKNDITFRVEVTVNGKQEYNIKENDYDRLCDKLTDVMIRETL